jgi:hypothetical protein
MFKDGIVMNASPLITLFKSGMEDFYKGLAQDNHFE